jgi:hypothetical protein
MINRERPRAIRFAWARALTAEAVRPRSSAMSESETLETTRCRSRSSSSAVHAFRLFVRLVAISPVMFVSGPLTPQACLSLLQSLGSALAADRQQHFLLSRCGLAWLLALRWFSPAVVCDAAFQGIHQVDYIFALWPRLRSNGLAAALLTQFKPPLLLDERQRPVRPWNGIRRRCRRDRKLALCCRNPRSRTFLSRYGRRLPSRALLPVRNRRRQSR